MAGDVSMATSPTLLGRLGRLPVDQAAWGEFAERYGRKIYGWCRHWRLQQADAEEVTQEVLLKLARKMATFQYDPKRSFRAWLKTVTHHTWRDFLDSRRLPGRFGLLTRPSPTMSTAVDSTVMSDRTPAEEYKDMVEAIRKGREAYSHAVQGKTGEDIAAAGKEYGKFFTLETFAPKFLRLIQRSPQEPTAIKAFSWLMAHQPNSPAASQAVELIIEYHLQSDEMGNLCQEMSYPTSPVGEKLLRALLERSQRRNVQGYARNALANHLKCLADSDEDLAQAQKEAMLQEAGKLLEEVRTIYGDMPLLQGTFGQEAERGLYEIRHLSVGMIAPEIIGTDIDDKPMRLSDYRGKIVVLLFWGFW